MKSPIQVMRLGRAARAILTSLVERGPQTRSALLSAARPPDFGPKSNWGNSYFSRCRYSWACENTPTRSSLIIKGLIKEVDSIVVNGHRYKVFDITERGRMALEGLPVHDPRKV